MAIYDVLLDIDQERQLSPDHVAIRILRNLVRFTELFPGDSTGTRDRYCEVRWKAVKFLERIGAVRNVRYLEGNHRWESYVEMDPTLPQFSQIFSAVESEYFRRTGTKEQRVDEPQSVNMTNKVFVIHGRNLRLRDGMFAFLRSIALDPIEWTEAVDMTDKSAPYVGEILEKAFAHAQVVVVLLSGDDEARLRPELQGENEPLFEKELTPQARANALFEAGMAMAFNSRRTVLVEFGHVRPFSDLGGRHTIKMDGSTEKRQALAMRLSKAGCPVKMTGTDWHSCGDLRPSAQ